MLGRRFTMVELISRPTVDWHMEGLTKFTRAYSYGCPTDQLINISVIRRSDLISQIFTKDNIH